jgi:hypothetical protein
LSVWIPKCQKEEVECQHDSTNGKTLVRRQRNNQSHGPSHTNCAAMATVVPVSSSIMPMKPHKEAVLANDETNLLLQQQPRPLDGKQVEHLVERGFTRGLGTSLNHTSKGFACRIWIIDNSGSMQKLWSVFTTTTNWLA